MKQFNIFCIVQKNVFLQRNRLCFFFLFFLFIASIAKSEEIIICKKIRILSKNDAIPLYWKKKHRNGKERTLFYVKHLTLDTKRYDSLTRNSTKTNDTPSKTKIKIRIDGKPTKFTFKKKSFGIYLLRLNILRELSYPIIKNDDSNNRTNKKDVQLNKVEIQYKSDMCVGEMNLINGIDKKVYLNPNNNKGLKNKIEKMELRDKVDHTSELNFIDNENLKDKLS